MKVILFVGLISFSSTLNLHSSTKVLNRDLVLVEISTPLLHHHRDRRHTHLPDLIHINVENTNLKRTFQVEKHHSTDTSVPLFISGKLYTKSYYPKVLTQYYQCVDKDCLFQAEKVIDLNSTTVNSNILLFGTFYSDGRLHILEPTGNGEHTVTVPEVSSNMFYDIPYETEKVSLKSDDTKDQVLRKKRAVGNFVVELLIVIDYSAYKFWFDEKNGVQSDTVEAIKQFYAFMIKGMDLRYQNIPGASFTIDIVHAGLYILQDENSASFIEDVKNCTATSKCTVDSDTVLTAFQNWLQTTATALPHDHAMLFTRYDIETQGNTQATGYAFLGSICTNDSVSVVEEDFNFISQTIAAHELGHSLSAVHDGDQNLCSGSSQYIMATTNSASTGSTSTHPWIFSTCSVDEINTQLNNITASNNNCLVTSASSKHNELDSYLSQNIGQVYSADKQCQLAVGEGSYACRSSYVTAGNFNSVCSGLWCKSIVLVNKCSLVLPAERTACGSQKWCEGYQCVSSAQVPVLKEACIFGDQIGEVVTGFTCASLINQQPFQCYASSVSQQCCQSCDTIATGIAGCEYGDKVDCSAITSGSSCYTNGETCCKTCSAFVTNIPGCQYGDLATNCAVIQGGHQCYGTTGNSCCQTCNNYKTTISDCEYGDKQSGCVRNSCVQYNEQTRAVCCQTCDGVSIPTTGATTSVTSTMTTTTQQPTDALPDWLIPVAVSGGILILVITIIIIICCIRNSKRSSDPKKPSRRNLSHDIVRSHSEGRLGRQPQLTRQISREVIIYPQQHGKPYPLTRQISRERLPPQLTRQLSRGAIPPQITRQPSRGITIPPQHNQKRQYRGDQQYVNGGYSRY